MSYIVIADCALDDLIYTLVSQTDIDESDVWFKTFANSMGVYTTQIKTPFPTQCKRLLRFWVYIQVCKRNIGKNINRTQDGYEQDWFEVKAKEYQKLFDTELAAITPNIIMGIDVDNLNTNQKRSNRIERA
jgi:hypothetical protein